MASNFLGRNAGVDVVSVSWQSTMMEIVNDGGGKEFALEIASVVYDTQLAFDWDVVQLTFRLSEGPMEIGDMDELVRRSHLQSIWNQVAWTYDALYDGTSTARAFVVLSEAQDGDSEKQLGMRYRFQRELESVLFRMFSLRERLFHLSNAYHRRGLTRDRIRGGYWAELKRAGVQDDFVAAVDEFLDDQVVGRFIRLRNDMTHNFELAIVGIGWPTLTHLPEKNGITGVGFGARYEGLMDFDQAVSDLRVVFEAITRMLRKLDGILLQDFRTPM